MTSIAHSERTQLCALAQRVGPDAPTLCEGWTARDLVVHLLLREGHPSSLAIVVSPLTPLLDRATERLARRDFDDLVTTLRHGPPRYSPFALPKLGELLNLLEFFVHHEDVRRAQPDWVPRELPTTTQDAIWRAVSRAGRGLLAKSEVGVVAERSDTGESVTWNTEQSPVVVRGLPTELALYAFGRRGRAVVAKEGEPEAIALLDETPTPV
ncbi:MAG: hypothetical protein QOK15_1152 [Nocardioidaceae bacterium]|nr:hypothetical protein [Nocardioidaceae bacterium]